MNQQQAMTKEQIQQQAEAYAKSIPIDNVHWSSDEISAARESAKDDFIAGAQAALASYAEKAQPQSITDEQAQQIADNILDDCRCDSWSSCKNRITKEQVLACITNECGEAGKLPEQQPADRKWLVDVLTHVGRWFNPVMREDYQWLSEVGPPYEKVTTEDLAGYILEQFPCSAQSDVSGALDIPPYLYSRAHGFIWFHYLHIKGGSGSKNGAGGQFRYYLYYATPEQEDKIGTTSPEFACDKLGIACGHGDTVDDAYAHFLTELEKFPLK